MKKQLLLILSEALTADLVVRFRKVLSFLHLGD